MKSYEVTQTYYDMLCYVVFVMLFITLYYVILYCIILWHIILNHNITILLNIIF